MFPVQGKNRKSRQSVVIEKAAWNCFPRKFDTFFGRIHNEICSGSRPWNPWHEFFSKQDQRWQVKSGWNLRRRSKRKKFLQLPLRNSTSCRQSGTGEKFFRGMKLEIEHPFWKKSQESWIRKLGRQGLLSKMTEMKSANFFNWTGREVNWWRQR